jgi:hypothetical protein
METSSRRVEVGFSAKHEEQRACSEYTRRAEGVRTEGTFPDRTEVEGKHKLHMQRHAERLLSSSNICEVFLVPRPTYEV